MRRSASCDLRVLAAAPRWRRAALFALPLAVLLALGLRTFARNADWATEFSLWKSAVANSGRHRFFSAFEQWAPILGNRNVTFVNLQYGDCRPELETAERDFNVKIWTPPNIDLKQDLDDVAALSCAMDLVIGFSNATFNIAAACGVPAWLISNPGAWPRLGTARYPWYPQVRVYLPEGFGAWDPIMARIGVDVAKLSTEWASNVAN